MVPVAARSLGTWAEHLHNREQVGVTTDLGLDPTLVRYLPIIMPVDLSPAPYDY